MKSSFSPPRITRIGSLRSVTAVASGPVLSDVRLKQDVEPYDAVLPRLKELSSQTNSDDAEGRRQFQEPVVRRQGSLEKITAVTSGPGAPSDASLKTDVEPYDSVLPRLKKLT